MQPEGLDGLAFNTQGHCNSHFSGATRRDRTGDLLITNQPLYQLS